mgnify:FL=1|jgi:hypothetical protein
MVIIIDNDNYWNELSKYKNLPYSFILFNQESFNWSNIFEYSRYKSNTKFIIKFEKYWINNQNAISNIFSLTLFDELTISLYPEFIDWKSNLIYNTLSIEFIKLYKIIIFEKHIKNLQYNIFIEICNKNIALFDLFMIDYIKYNKKTIYEKDLLQLLLHPNLMKKYLIMGYDYEGNKINLDWI